MTFDKDSQDVVAVILAGGLSRRMGQDKSFVNFPGDPIKEDMISYCFKRVKFKCNNIIINANGNPESFGKLKDLVKPDVITGYLGPLAGVHSGIYWAKQVYSSCKAIITIPVDSPFFPTDIFERLISSSQDLSLVSYAACSYSVNDKDGAEENLNNSKNRAKLDRIDLGSKIATDAKIRNHPTFALWPVSCLQSLEEFLKNSQNMRIIEFIKQLDGIRVVYDAKNEEDPFFNVNNKDDLALAGSRIISER